MDFRRRCAEIVAVVATSVLRKIKLGTGRTWSGELALRIDKDYLSHGAHKITKGIILIAGTNGKTTTSALIAHVLRSRGFSVIQNDTGANLENGIASVLAVSRASEYAVFEVDEAVLPIILGKLTPIIVVVLNLFRDQLDRYGEVDSVARKWQESLKALTGNTTVIANADDPNLAFITQSLSVGVTYFGLENPSLYRASMQFATDSIYCPKCSKRLKYNGVYLSHLGMYVCPSCGFHRPTPTFYSSVPSKLTGTYNQYNIIAGIAVVRLLGITTADSTRDIATFEPAFGRQEVIQIDGKSYHIFLSKNPTGFNESLITVLTHANAGDTIVLALNDRIPDGTDVSWIWDVDFELLGGTGHGIVVTGDRALDMAVRMKYAGIAGSRVTHAQAPTDVVVRIGDSKEVWVLATYSAMLDLRQVLTGRKIL